MGAAWYGSNSDGTRYERFVINSHDPIQLCMKSGRLKFYGFHFTLAVIAREFFSNLINFSCDVLV